MQAHVGDEIAVHSRHVGEPARHGVITEVRGANGTPPYVVRWQDGTEAVFFPSADCTIACKDGEKAAS
ncbi:DUF1918 domain-containing protein [Acidothermus cellulolyticus]|jgi:hypothetical protein|uniref:DUF1918 domain-containing protein n=1 Tax=Acidothermus cellulolyticus TaxID=28049 RepID=UPI000311FA7D|nr:DUF1918 domain-containing protein [Acidothermus cellulolyticus]